MQCPSSDIKKKVDSMLASFRREKAKGKKTIGTGKGRQDIYVSTWFAFTRMAFLLDRDEPARTISSCTEDDTELEKVDEIETYETSETVIGAEDPSTVGTIANNSLEGIVEIIPESQTTCPKLKRTCPSSIQKTVKQKIPRESKIDEAFDMLKSVVVKQKTEVPDACSDYGKHVANKLRNYSERVKAMVQYHFNNILFEADMGNFDVNKNTATMTSCSSATLPTGNTTTPTPTPSPQETVQSSMSYTDLSSPLSDMNCLEERSTSTETVFLTTWEN